MKAEESNFYQWQDKVLNHRKCLSHLAQLRWGNGFQCDHCRHDNGYWTQKHHRYECAKCHRQ